MPATRPKRDEQRREVRDGEKERLVVRPDDTENRAINRRGCFQRTGGSVVKEKCEEADWVTKSPVRHKLYRVLLTDFED